MAVDDLMLTDKSMRSIFEISKRFSALTAIEYIDKKGKVVRISYKSYFERIQNAAAVISEKLAHVDKGSVIGLKMNNSPIWGVIFWGLLMSGYQPLLLDARAGADAVSALLADSGAKALICEDAYSYAVQRLSAAELTLAKARHRFTAHWEDHVLFCTSGTTDKPKIVVFSGLNLSYQIASAKSMPERTCDIMYPPEIGTLKILAMLPFHHIFGFVAVFLWYTFFGRTLVYLENLLPETILGTCRRLEVSHVYAVPLLWNNIAQTLKRQAARGGQKHGEIFQRLVAYHTGSISRREAGYGASRSLLKKIHLNLMGRSIKYCISGGGYLPADTLRIINGIGYPLYNGYGLTEVGVTSVELDGDVRRRTMGSIGRPLYMMEYGIAPADGSDANTGELIIRSKTTHIGTMQEGRFVPREEAEWFHTGDIVSRDDAGNYYFRGRIKDTIINADGENVFPDEIEGAFSGLPHIGQLCVFGVSRGGEERERITLVLTLAKSLSPEERAGLCDDIRRINGGSPLYKQVQDVYISAAPLPVVNTIKIQRIRLRGMLLEHPEAFERLNLLGGKDFGGYPKEYIEQILSGARDVFAQVLHLGSEGINDFGHFVYDLGGDSLTYASLILEIERRFDVSIPPQEYGRCFSVNDFAMLIAKLKRA